jgi:hypothetical protein
MVSRRKEEREKYQQKSLSGFASEEEMLSKTTLVTMSFLSIPTSILTPPRPNASTQ